MDGLDDLGDELDLEEYSDDLPSIGNEHSDQLYDHSPIVAGGDIDLVSEYDTSTREGREKLAKDIHQALTDSAVGRNVLMRNSFSNPLSREEFRKEVEQSTYEHAMEEGASSRTVSGGSVIESMNQAAEEVNEQSSILEQYRPDEDPGYLETEFETDF